MKAIKTFSYANESSHNEVLEYEVRDTSLNEQGVYKGEMLSSNSSSTTSEDGLVLEVKWWK